MSNYENKLIYGIDTTSRIVSVEPQGEKLVVFRELENGDVVQENREARYWFITNKSISPAKEYKLEGDQFFKYFHEFTTLEKQREVRAKLYQKRLEFYDIYDAKESNLVIHGMTYYKGMQPADVSTLSFDIETDGLVQNKNSEIYIITNTFRKQGQVIKKGFFLEDYRNVGEMLTAWCDWVREMNPSLVIGHNIYGYDFPYLAHVAKLNKVELKLGRDGSVLRFNEKESRFRKDGSQEYEYHKAYIFGREIVDTFFLSIKYDVARNFPSYGLKPIIKYLGLEKADRTFVDAGKMKHIYHNRHKDSITWERAKAYALDDSDDALTLFDMMIPSFFYMTQSISKSFQEMNTSATGSQLNNMMVRAYLQDGHSVAKASEAEPFEGGISLGIPGIYKNCLKWDLASAYPHTIIQFELYDKLKDPKKYFLIMVNYFTKERIKNKKLAKDTGLRYYKDLEQSQKVAINSFFGFCGAQGLNYNAPHIAAEITRRCRGYIMDSIEWSTGRRLDYWKSLTNEAE